MTFFRDEEPYLSRFCDEEKFNDGHTHIPAPRSVPPIGSPLPTCAICGYAYMQDEEDTDE